MGEAEEEAQEAGDVRRLRRQTAQLLGSGGGTFPLVRGLRGEPSWRGRPQSQAEDVRRLRRQTAHLLGSGR